MSILWLFVTFTYKTIMKKRLFPTLPMGTFLLLALVAQAQDSLIISEVTDPADDYSGRFIELYNSGSEAIDFAATTCYLSRQSNGGTSWGDLPLTGRVDGGSTFVIGGSGFEAIYGFAPDQVSGILTGNGNDAYFLFREGDHDTGVLLDIFGTLDTDGTGELWEYVDSRAERVEDILAPRIIWMTQEWEITPANVADCDPGTHHGSAGTDTLSVGPYTIALDNDTVQLGQVVEIPVSLIALTAADSIISYQFNIDFDPAVLEYTGFELSGTLAEGGVAVVHQGSAGTLSIGYMTTTALAGEGVILILRFNPLVIDTTELFISDAWLNSIPLQEVINGSVIIVDVEPPTAYILYSDTVHRFADTLSITAIFSKPISHTDPVRIAFSGAVTLAETDMNRVADTVYNYLVQIPKTEGVVTVLLSHGTDLQGNEVVSVPTSGGSFTITAFLPGDVNDDGMILAHDAAITLQYSVGIDPLPGMDPLPWEYWRDSTANVDGTGGITAYDASLILQYSAGMISNFSDASTTLSPAASITVDVVDQELVFHSFGELFGFNLSTTNENGMLEAPVALTEEYLSASNTFGTTYRVGLCTASPASDGRMLMKIPFSGSGSVTFRLMVNKEESYVTVDLSTGWVESENEFIKIYPNPATDLLKITGLTTATSIGIYNIYGELLLTASTCGPTCEIDLANLSAGIYMVLLKSNKRTRVRRFCIF
jgi:hypothetical protein